MNIYKFEVKDSDIGIAEVTISIKGNIYFTKCSCNKENIKRCKHVLLVIAGKAVYSNEEGLHLQKKMIDDLIQSQSGLYVINNIRFKAKLSPFCEKCKEIMEPIAIQQNFLKKTFGIKQTHFEFICKKCNRKTVYNI